MMDLFNTPEAPSEAAQVREVFEHWQVVMGYTKKSLTSERRAKIKSRLKVFSVADLKRTIDIVSVDPWWRGENSNRKAYDDIVNIFRNDTRVENFLDNAGPARSGRSLFANQNPNQEDSF